MGTCTCTCSCNCTCTCRVVELCLAAATRRDPSNLALHFYKNGENPEDSAGVAAFHARAACYSHVTGVLGTLAAASTLGTASPSVPLVPGPPPPTPPSSLPPTMAREWEERVFALVVASTDQLVHVTLYQWLVAQGNTDRLLAVRWGGLVVVVVKSIKCILQSFLNLRNMRRKIQELVKYFYSSPGQVSLYRGLPEGLGRPAGRHHRHVRPPLEILREERSVACSHFTLLYTRFKLLSR